MSHRQKRLEKLIQHRAREVDKQLVKLAECRTREQQVRSVAEAEKQKLENARTERAEALSRPLDAQLLTLKTDWLVTCGKRKEIADRAVDDAVRAVVDAQKQLLLAKNELKKIELIKERLAAEERVRSERNEQRATDEFAALRFVEAEKRRGEA